MQGSDIAQSYLPSFLLPCPQCGHRMAITSVVPARLENGIESDDLEDITHGCVYCGTTLTRAVRPLSSDAYHSLDPAAPLSPAAAKRYCLGHTATASPWRSSVKDTAPTKRR
jgi:hypothetical protein